MARSKVQNSICYLLAGALAANLLGNVFIGGWWYAASQSASRKSVTLRAEGATAVLDRLQLKVLSPEGQSFKESVSEVILPSASGQLGVLANHAPMMSALDIGVLRYKKDGIWKPVVVFGGFASVDANQLNVLVNDWETAEKIDVVEAKKQMEVATKDLEKADSKKDKLDATTKVKKAAARVQAAMFGSKK